jgi:hypothetical protein
MMGRRSLPGILPGLGLCHAVSSAVVDVWLAVLEAA